MLCFARHLDEALKTESLWQEKSSQIDLEDVSCVLVIFFKKTADINLTNIMLDILVDRTESKENIAW